MAKVYKDYKTLKKVAEIKGFDNTDQLRYKCKVIGCEYGGGMVSEEEFDEKFAKWMATKKKRKIDPNLQKKMQKGRMSSTKKRKVVKKTVRATTLGKVYDTVNQFGLNIGEQYVYDHKDQIDSKAISMVDLVKRYNKEYGANVTPTTFAHNKRRMKKYGIWIEGSFNLSKAEQHILKDGEDYWKDRYESQTHYITDICDKYKIGVETLRKDFNKMKQMNTYERYKKFVLDRNPFLTEED